jgi:diguanylate cyclase (GGDEF)-like protein
VLFISLAGYTQASVVWKLCCNSGVVVYQDVEVSHLTVLSSFDEVAGFNLSPDIIWIFDLDRHGFWWGNKNALEFWGLSDVQQLIDKDLSADTEGARKRTEQTFVKAALEKVTYDPWTTYPNGEPKVMIMRHVAVLLGPEKHRGIIAFISEQMDAPSQPENLLFAEAVRYTSVAVSCFDMQGKRLFENPAFTELYGNESCSELGDFGKRFVNQVEAKQRLQKAQNQQDGHEEHMMLTKQGEKRLNVDIRTSRHPITGDYVFLVTEYDITQLHHTISELENTKEQLKQLAHYDTLTQLPSVWFTKEKLKSALIQANRLNNHVAVMFMDLDGFKPVNDKFGHCVGDDVLKQVAKRLTGTFRESDTVGRLGGDEFLVCLPNLDKIEQAIMLAGKAIEEVAKPFYVTDEHGLSHQVEISASLGVAFYPDSDEDPETLIKLADKNMYKAKQSGKNRFEY